MPLHLPNIGTVEERFFRLIHELNRAPIVLPFVAVGSTESVNFGASAIFGAITVERTWLRTLVPDGQWRVRAAGLVDPADANGVKIELEYRTDGASSISLGSITPTGAGTVKAALGPFDVFATASVPSAESIPLIRLRATKQVSGTAYLTHWVIWLELRTSQQG